MIKDGKADIEEKVLQKENKVKEDVTAFLKIVGVKVDIVPFIAASGLRGDNIGKKLAAYKTPEEFNFALSRLVETYNSFNLEAIKAKADGVGAKTVFENDGILILQIDNFNQSKSLGSSSWCISRDPHYFSSYTENDNKQYFIYNFNKD